MGATGKEEEESPLSLYTPHIQTKTEDNIIVRFHDKMLRVRLL
jgi:hypothetical protein